MQEQDFLGSLSRFMFTKTRAEFRRSVEACCDEKKKSLEVKKNRKRYRTNVPTSGLVFLRTSSQALMQASALSLLRCTYYICIDADVIRVEE